MDENKIDDTQDVIENAEASEAEVTETSAEAVTVPDVEDPKQAIKEWIRDILLAVIIAVIILQFIKPTIVKESSMEPTLYSNNYLFLSKQAYTFGEPQRGDIIVFHSGLTTGNGFEKLLIKRVVGLPGDVISIIDGQVFINGEIYEEPYIKDGYTTGYIEDKVIPEGELFCMGDNRVVSMDCRDERIGNVPIDQVVGKAIFRLYPFSLIGPASSWVDKAAKSAEVAGDYTAPILQNQN